MTKKLPFKGKKLLVGN